MRERERERWGVVIIHYRFLLLPQCEIYRALGTKKCCKLKGERKGSNIDLVSLE